MAALQAMLCARSLCFSPAGARGNSFRGSARNLHLYQGYGSINLKLKRINLQISRQLCICKSQSANKIDSLSPIIKNEKAELKKEGQLSPQTSYLLDLGMELKSIEEICQKWPDLTRYSVDHKIRPITEFFIEKGFSIGELCYMLNKYGKLYEVNLEAHLVPKWEYFLTTDYPKLEIVKFPKYFTYSLEKRIKPRFERMKNCGARLSLSKMLFHDDKKFDNFLQKEMGVLRLKSKKLDFERMDIYLEKCPKIFEFFGEKGFSKEEIVVMIGRFESICNMCVNTNLKPKWEYFLTMGYKRLELVKFPNYFGCSLEKRIKPRFERMVELGVKLPFYCIVILSDAKLEESLERQLANQEIFV